MIIAIVSVFVPSILATEFVVGDDQGWATKFDYQSWAQGKEFHVGDKLGKLTFYCLEITTTPFNKFYRYHYLDHNIYITLYLKNVK